MSRPRNQEKWEEISRLRGIGTPLQTISRMVGMDLSSVRYVLQQAGIPYIRPRRNPRAISQVPIPDDHTGDMRKGPRSKIQAHLEARRTEWKRLYEEEHYSMVQIARLFGRDHTIVMRELRRAGVTARPYGQNKNRVRPVTSCRVASPRLVRVIPPRTLKPYEPANPLVIQRMMDISLRIERRSRGLLA